MKTPAVGPQSQIKHTSNWIKAGYVATVALAILGGTALAATYLPNSILASALAYIPLSTSTMQIIAISVAGTSVVLGTVTVMSHCYSCSHRRPVVDPKLSHDSTGNFGTKRKHESESEKSTSESESESEKSTSESEESGSSYESEESSGSGEHSDVENGDSADETLSQETASNPSDLDAERIAREDLEKGALDQMFHPTEAPEFPIVITLPKNTISPPTSPPTSPVKTPPKLDHSGLGELRKMLNPQSFNNVHGLNHSSLSPLFGAFRGFGFPPGGQRMLTGWGKQPSNPEEKK